MFPSLVFAVAFRAAAGLVTVVQPAGQPPKEIAHLIEQLTTRRGEIQDGAVARLSRLAAAEPYIRALPPARDGLTRQQAAATLAALHNRACERSLDRHAPGWAKAGRVDMLVELACLTTNERLAGRIFDLTLSATSKLNPYMILPPPLSQADGRLFPRDSYAMFSKITGFLRVTDGELMTGSNAGNVFVHSPSFKTDVGGDRSYWLCLIGDRLTETSPRPHDWWQSILAVNNTSKFENLFQSIAIVDGDIDLVSQFGHCLLEGSVLICRGSIRSRQKLSINRTLLVAGGDINLPTGPNRSVCLYAGGRVAVANVAGKPVIKEGADLSITGVRFFELSDVGVETAADKAGVRITKLDPRSPLTFYGLKVGDVVTKLNGQPMVSVNEFRRHARRSVVLRAGIFHIQRGGESLSRIVYFDGLLEPRK